MAQLDDAAADNTWHDVPDLSRENFKKQARDAYGNNKPFGKAEAKDAAGDAAQTAHPEGSRDPADTAALAAQDQQEGTASGVDAATGARAGAETLKGAAKENVPEDKQNKTREYRDRTREYLRGKMPRERREQTIWRLKKMVIEIQGHEDCECAQVVLDSLKLIVHRHASCRYPFALGRRVHRPLANSRRPRFRLCQRRSRR